MLEMIIGGFVALFLLGLPLAIIALFIASTLERRPANAEKAKPLQVLRTQPLVTNYDNDKRRRIIYLRPSPSVTEVPEHNKPGHLRETKT
jgi:flagellar basal body-associated protein FliL